MAQNILLTDVNVVPETELGTPGTAWSTLEPSSVNNAGLAPTFESKELVTNTLFRQKGELTDINSSFEFEHDLNFGVLNTFKQGIVLSNAANSDVINIPVTVVAINSGAMTLTVPTLSTDQAAKLVANRVVWLSGFSDITNNGRGVVVTASGTSIALGTSVEGTQVAKAAATDVIHGYVSFIGVRVTASSAWDADTNLLTFTGASAIADLGPVKGQMVHIGSVARIGEPLTQTFTDGGGFGRVTTDSGALILDKVDSDLQNTGSSTSIDVLFCDYLKAVSFTDSTFKLETYSFESILADLEGEGTDGYIYSEGNAVNTFSISVTASEKVTGSFSFTGIDTDDPTATQAAGTRTKLHQSKLYAGSTGVGRLRLAGVDNDGLYTDFSELTVNFNNNIVPRKYITELTASDLISATKTITIEGRALLTDSKIIDAIRSRKTFSLDLALSNNDGIVVFDFTSIVMTSLAFNYEDNDVVDVNINFDVVQDEDVDFPEFQMSVIPCALVEKS